MSTAVSTEFIHRHLRNLDSVRRARELFTELNYEYANELVHVPTTAAFADLVESPQVIAKHGDFKIIYSRLASKDRLLRSVERPIVEQLLPGNEFSLFLFSDDDASHWDLVNVKLDPEQRNRRIHRRISIGPEERRTGQLRTASEQLTSLYLANNELDQLVQRPLEIQRRHDVAFEVEKVTRRFYEEYAAVFRLAKQQIRGIEDEDRLHLFTQRLFNRLMFLAFIQKKDWLTLEGDTDYLNALWRAYQADPHADNFYNRRLFLLFFDALDNPASRNLMRDNPSLHALVGDVPYLNGGLFERKPDDDLRRGIVVPDEAIEAILEKLFNSFNFTVTESTPLDVEVAVDPEMLGKVFEELVTGRHESGSYYTPKPIVSFMCREALKAHLTTKLPSETPEAIEALVDDHEAGTVRDPEGVLEALKTVTACDPACGSGAYLLGMLHELLDIRRKLFTSRNIDSLSEYRRKLEIIQNNIYGVDIDPFATNIARLRLWLSLAVDYDGDQPEPLPNLDFKIETGNSLLMADVRPKEIVVETGDAASGYAQQFTSSLGLRDALIDRFRHLKSEYLQAHEEDKKRCREEILKVRRSIQDLAGRSDDQGDNIDWPVEFAEVFADGGFDIVLANPPYVRQELIRDIKPELKHVYGDLYSGTADLYVYFYYRALEILKPGGALAFISSNKWFKANYGQKLREHIAGTTNVLSITDFGDLPVFESAAAYPMIFIAHKQPERADPTRFTEVTRLDAPYPDVKAVIQQEGDLLPPDALAGERWLLADEQTVNLILTMERDTIPLGKYVDGQIYRGVLTGFNTAFVIDGARRAELIAADPKSSEIIKPLATGRDIRRWHIRDSDRWLIVTKVGVDIKRFPAIFEHLSQWKPQLRKRYDQGNHWWELRACAYYDVFDQAKITFPDIAGEPRFAMDIDGRFINDTCFMIGVNDPFLLGLLNSSVVQEWFEFTSAAIRGGYARYKPQYVQQIPIPVVHQSDREAVSQLAQECINDASNPVRLAELESEIDERVAILYKVQVATNYWNPEEKQEVISG